MDYNPSPTPEDLLAMVERRRQQLSDTNSRELVLAEVNVLPEVPREVDKDEKTERLKDISRDDREESDCLASPPFGELPQLPQPQVDLDNESGPREVSSRDLTFSGVTIQHSKTKSGIKLYITLQQPSEQDSGDTINITAELKRHDRLRELKACAQDSYEFAMLYQGMRKQLQKDPECRSYCIGRAHQRGKRSSWVPDTMVVANMNDQGQITSANLYYQDEQYNVQLDQELSKNQINLFHSTGIYGSISRGKVPALLSMPKSKFK
jgi:hypothetical protein